MDILQYTYRPMQAPIATKCVDRPQGYTGHKIHMHDHHELVLVTSRAVCRLLNNGRPVQVNAPCVILNRAGTFHEVVEVTQGQYDSQVVFFHPQIMKGLPDRLLYEDQLFAADLTAISLSEEQLRELQPLVELLHHRPYAQQLPLLLAVLAALDQFLGEAVHVKRSTAAENYIFDVIELLQSQQESWTLDRLSRRFHVCQTKLKADFKRITGLPVMTYKNHIRLEKARLLLTSTGMEQTQIAYSCGFSDESYFIRSFRKQYGITPAAYRKAQK